MDSLTPRSTGEARLDEKRVKMRDIKEPKVIIAIAHISKITKYKNPSLKLFTSSHLIHISFEQV